MKVEALAIKLYHYTAGGYGMYKVEQLAVHGRLTITKSPGAGSVAGQLGGVVSREDFAQYVDYSPHALRGWLSAEPAWRSFDESYLVAWGARQLPLIAGGRWWLWATPGACPTILHIFTPCPTVVWLIKEAKQAVSHLHDVCPLTSATALR